MLEKLLELLSVNGGTFDVNQQLFADYNSTSGLRGEVVYTDE